MSKDNKYTVWIHPRAYHLMSLWAELAGKKKQEMTCFGQTSVEDGEIVVEDAHLIEHMGSSASVDGDEDDIIRMTMELYEKGVMPDQVRCWTHSHPGTGPSATYLSGTDEDNIERYLTGEWLVSIVFDSKGQYPYCRIDFKEPRVSVEAELKMYIEYLSEEEVKAATEEFKEKASSHSFTYIGGGKGKGASGASGFAGTGVYGGGSRYGLVDDEFGDDMSDWAGWQSSYVGIRQAPPRVGQLSLTAAKDDGPTDEGDGDGAGDESDDEPTVAEEWDAWQREHHTEAALLERDLDELCYEVVAGKMPRETALQYMIRDFGLDNDVAHQELEKRVG
jgi:hypothetical protein